jgi:hypothetical protein
MQRSGRYGPPLLVEVRVDTGVSPRRGTPACESGSMKPYSSPTRTMVCKPSRPRDRQGSRGLSPPRSEPSEGRQRSRRRRPLQCRSWWTPLRMRWASADVGRAPTWRSVVGWPSSRERVHSQRLQASFRHVKCLLQVSIQQARSQSEA